MEDGTIIIGNKPFMNYVNAVVMSFTTKDLINVSIKANGKNISKAISVINVSKKLLNNTFKVDKMDIGSIPFKNKKG